MGWLINIITACTTLLRALATACHNAGLSVGDDLHALLILTQQGGPGRASRPVLHTVTSQRISDAPALAKLLVELDLLLPDQVGIDDQTTLVTCCRVWRWVQAHGLTALPWRAVLHGLLHGPRAQTRQHAGQTPSSAFWYARLVDHGPHDDTRTAACASPVVAVQYARLIDRAAHAETCAAACEPATAHLYTIVIAALRTPAVCAYRDVSAPDAPGCDDTERVRTLRGPLQVPAPPMHAVAFVRAGDAIVAVEAARHAAETLIWEITRDDAARALLGLHEAQRQQRIADGLMSGPDAAAQGEAHLSPCSGSLPYGAYGT
ncbi:MAG TPA: hypothetical protein VFZ66_03660 [Herpetosiphonaceae bacterium]